MTPDNSISISDGVVLKGKKEILSGLTPGCDTKSFSLSDFSFLWLDKDTVMMTYTAAQDVTCAGKNRMEK